MGGVGEMKLNCPECDTVFYTFQNFCGSWGLSKEKIKVCESTICSRLNLASSQYCVECGVSQNPGGDRQ